MMSLGILVVIVFFITVAGGGFGYWIFIKTRPSKIAWRARIYTVGEGVRPPKLDADGNLVSNISLTDLRPYGKDVLQRVVKGHGIIIYKLLKLNAPTNEPTANCIDYWGPEDKEVNVLKVGDSYSVLNKGYDFKSGEVVFTPLSYETSSMLQNQVILRKDRLKQEKDVLAQITPWIVTGIVMLSLIAVTWMLIQAFVGMSETTNDAMEYAADKQVEAGILFHNGILLYKGYDPIGLTQEKPAEDLGQKPPSIE